jgi:hypothetical protein
MLTDQLLIVVTALGHLENDILQRSPLGDLPVYAMGHARRDLTNVQDEVTNLTPHVVLGYQTSATDWSHVVV